MDLCGGALGRLQVFHQLRVAQEVSRGRGQTGQQVVLQRLQSDLEAILLFRQLGLRKKRKKKNEVTHTYETLMRATPINLENTLAGSCERHIPVVRLSRCGPRWSLPLKVQVNTRTWILRSASKVVEIDAARISYAEPRRRRPRLDYPLYRLVAEIKLERRYLTHQRDEGRRFRAGGETALMVWDPLPAPPPNTHPPVAKLYVFN